MAFPPRVLSSDVCILCYHGEPEEREESCGYCIGLNGLPTEKIRLLEGVSCTKAELRAITLGDMRGEFMKSDSYCPYFRDLSDGDD
jgi:hypothetical protein